MALLQKEIGSWFAEKIKPKEVQEEEWFIQETKGRGQQWADPFRD